MGLTSITSMSHTAHDGYVNDFTKIVTIKGVDTKLYNLFSTLVNLNPASSGLVFTHILLHYMRNIKPLVPIAPRKRLVNPSSKINYEVIQSQESLRVSKSDFEATGNNIQFIFIDVNELVFDKSINTDEIVKYVHGIHNSNVKVEGKVSRLILSAIDRSDMTTLKGSNELKDVTIRNVSGSIYEEFTALCHQESIAVGEGINKMLGIMVPHLEIVEIVKRLIDPTVGPPIIISLKHDLRITKADLEDLGNRMLLLHRIDHVEFDKKIPLDLFTDTIFGIYNCSDVILPETIPKLLQLSKQKNFP